MSSIILAAPDVLCEPDLVGAAAPAGLTVVRRCVDAADLLACAAADPCTAVVISAGVPRLSGDLVARLRDHARPVVALVVLDEDEGRVRAWGIDTVVRVTEPRQTMTHVAEALDAGPGQDRLARGATSANDPRPNGVWQTGLWADDHPAKARSSAPSGAGPQGASGAEQAAGPTGSDGSIVAVWGAAGSPGRTTTAIGLAQACAAAGRRTLLVDADTYAPSMALLLGIAEDASGLIVACRHADNATLSSRSLRASARSLSARLAVLGGLPRADRWPDLRESALARLWQACRQTFEVTVVDTGPCIEHEPHGSLNPVLASRRNAAAITALGHSDAVVSVGRGDALGVARLAAGYPQLLECAGDAERLIAMVTPARGAVGWAQVRDALRGVGLGDPMVRLEPAPRQHARRARLGRLPHESRYAGRERATVEALAGRVLAILQDRMGQEVPPAA
ncbi:MAG: hypothetical protein KGP12_01355 [Actinomycetales bacterium]|nr:hypothetical protein [Actinomycetales bacterium]